MHYVCLSQAINVIANTRHMDSFFFVVTFAKAMYKFSFIYVQMIFFNLHWQASWYTNHAHVAQA
jgi:hypothetical protein